MVFTTVEAVPNLMADIYLSPTEEVIKHFHFLAGAIP
jgi:hypothetical protein